MHIHWRLRWGETRRINTSGHFQKSSGQCEAGRWVLIRLDAALGRISIVYVPALHCPQNCSLSSERHVFLRTLNKGGGKLDPPLVKGRYALGTAAA